MALSFGCTKKEAAPITANEAGQQDETAAAQTQDKPLEQIMQAAKEPIRNPFLTEEEENELIDTGNLIPADYLILSAVIYSSLNKSKAIVNGQILKMGDYVDNKEIIEIQPEAVILKDARAQYIIRLKNIPGV
ncbi:MAG: hypothetical protein AAB456_02710 [Patescibacteria group bacterium]